MAKPSSKKQHLAQPTIDNVNSGSDVILSAVEYIGILVHQYSFIANYSLAANIRTALILAGSFFVHTSMSKS
jgi:hypothetical protein